MSQFQGFPKDTFAFLKALENNNSKGWFDENRAWYESAWKGPALDFIAVLSDQMSALQPPLQAVPKLNGSLRRINRDLRFSKDKTPYNPRLHLVFWAGAHPNRSAGFHFVLHGDGIGYGAGAFGFNATTLTTYRDAVMDPRRRALLIEALDVAETVGSILEPPALARVPKGYNGDPSCEGLLKQKSVVARTMQNKPLPEWLESGEAIDAVLALTRAHLPLIRWLQKL